MFGFFFGTACLAGLIFALRRHHWHHHHGRGGRGSWRGRMRWVFVKAADDLTEAFEKLRDEARVTRTAIAQALRGEQFDAASLRELHEKHDALLAQMRETLRTSMAQVHEALDPRQRRELADLIEHGFGYGYRGYGGCGGYGRHGGPRYV